MKMRFWAAVMVAAMAGVWTVGGPMWGEEAKPVAAAPATEKPVVQLAILLDTSNSMDGLIDQAKTQLWRIVNEFATAKRGGQAPMVQVALYQYGTPALGVETGYIKQVVPLTDDLDKISEELFKLKTNGGDEYCGQVIQHAAENLKWSTGKQDYKAIFIAGNEPFTQGTVEYSKACKAAIAKGIIVNTIFCGDTKEGIDTKWKDGADLADGSYMSIDQNQKAVVIAAPQDKEIAELGVKLNQTYVSYGKAGAAGKMRQVAQDANAAMASTQAAAQRVQAKSSALYQNSSWDMVDAAKDGTVKVEDLKEAELPEEMKKMTVEQRKTYVEGKQKDREELQKKISELGRERDKYVAAKQKEAAGGGSTLDTAILKTVHEQAQRVNLQFEAATTQTSK